MPRVRQLLDEVPHRQAAARVEAGRRLVEEEDRRRVDERGGQVEPAAHAAGVGLARCGRRRRRGRTRSSSSAARRRRSAGAAGRGGRPSPGSRARSAARRAAAYWPATPICRRTSVGCWATSMPATSARPASGRVRVVRMRTAVVLPAPLGPSMPRIVPSATSRSSPRRAWVLPKCLWRPSARIMVRGMDGGAYQTTMNGALGPSRRARCPCQHRHQHGRQPPVRLAWVPHPRDDRQWAWEGR